MMLSPVNTLSPVPLSADLANASGRRLLAAQWWRQPISAFASLAPIEPVEHTELKASGVSVSIKREDALCPYLGGNKLYKLYFHVQRALTLNAQVLVTFGGAYSNHIYALARAGLELGIQTVGIIRGEKPPYLSPTLQDALAMGMRLQFVSRAQYKLKHTQQQQATWGLPTQGTYIIPEGGSGIRGALGMAEYWRCVQQVLNKSCQRYDAVVLAAGTGASLAGVMAASEGIAVHGILALKGSAKMTQHFTQQTLAMAQRLRRVLRHPNYGNKEVVLGETMYSKPSPMCWQLHTQAHGGGYGPAKGALRDTIQHLEASTGIALDPVYTGKMMAAVIDLAQQQHWRGQRVLVIHSGGLQGAR
ncbi:1-aminocyclopropane-1-carboxylate deaminase/D-cysteine desulfhydrase [Marinagarivorans algicola]|uniref:1-aminocyclopropane-1-carboxylate deaminase/D-cysteine desulfhydrase n=1 Tax=Marinagarivorans algicola TaxID=1513270 RepID=UPI0006B52F26|nr:pyridoxal-phosphate dependent enzyme [Marinagarivorans algicola]